MNSFDWLKEWGGADASDKVGWMRVFTGEAIITFGGAFTLRGEDDKVRDAAVGQFGSVKFLNALWWVMDDLADNTSGVKTMSLQDWMEYPDGDCTSDDVIRFMRATPDQICCAAWLLAKAEGEKG